MATVWCGNTLKEEEEEWVGVVCSGVFNGVSSPFIPSVARNLRLIYFDLISEFDMLLIVDTTARWKQERHHQF